MGNRDPGDLANLASPRACVYHPVSISTAGRTPTSRRPTVTQAVRRRSVLDISARRGDMNNVATQAD